MMIKVVNSSATSMVSGIATPQTVNSLLGLNSGSSGFIPLIPASSPSNPAVSANNIVPFSLNIGKQTKKPVSKKKTDDDDTDINAIIAFLTNPNIATPFTALMSAGAVLIPPKVIGLISGSSKEDIEYTNAVFEELFSNKELSPAKRKEILSNLIKFATDPDSIVVPKRFLDMHPTPDLRDKAAKEYRKAAQKVASIFVLFPMKFLTDLDGTFISYKAADFVSGTGVCASLEDREAALTFIYLLRKLNIGLLDYYKLVHNKTSLTPSEMEAIEAGFNALSMRGVLFGGVSIYGAPGKAYRIISKDGKLTLIIDKRSAYGHSEISAFATEMGFDTGIINTDNLKPFDIMILNGFGGLVKVREGKDIEIKPDLKKAANNMKTAINDQSVGWEEHFEHLLNYRGAEFFKQYEAYLTGDKQHIKLGYLHEMCLFANALGLQVFENKSMPSYMMHEEWAGKTEKPRYDHYQEIAELIKKLAVEKNQNWKTELKEKLTSLTKNESGKLLVTTALYNEIDGSQSLSEFFAKFSEGSPIIITVHAVDGFGNFMNPQSEKYNLTKEFIQLIGKKYCAEFTFADNGEKAPYIETVGYTFDKGDIVTPEEFSYSVGAGDSEGTDTGFIVAGINQAFSKEQEIRANLKNALEAISKITGTDHTNLSEEQKERLIQGAVNGLGIAPRGQIDLGNKVAIMHYAVNGAKTDQSGIPLGGPFTLEGVGTKDTQGYYDNYRLVGKRFKEHQNKTISKAEFQAVKDKKADSSNTLYKILEEKAVPFYKDSIARFADVHQHGQFWKGIMSDIFGLDASRIDSQALYNLIVPPSAQIDPYKSSLFQLTDTHQSLYDRVFNLQAQKNPHSLFAKVIFNAPNIGSALALIGAGMSAVGVAGKFYDTASGDNKMEASFGDIVAKGFSLANLGLAFSTVLLKTQFYPFQLLGSLIGVTSGFLPAGNIQQYLALSSMSLALLGSARESGFSNGSRIDASTADTLAEMKRIFSKVDPNLKSGPPGLGATYLDVKVPISDGNIWAEELHESMIKGLYDNLKIEPKIAEIVTKPIADISWNVRELVRTFKNPELLHFGSYQSATNGIEYKHSPHSMAHFLNTAGFASLGLLGITAGIQAFNHFTHKEEDDTDQKALIKAKNEKFNRNIRFLLDPRAKTKIINQKTPQEVKLEKEAQLKADQAKKEAENLSKVAYVVGGLSSLIPALVFLVQGMQIRQNALATRRSYTDPMGRQVTYRPGTIGAGLAISSGLQGLAAVGSGLAGMGLAGDNSAMALNISQSLYNLFAACSLAFSGLNIGGGGGGANLTMRNASVAYGIDQESNHAAQFDNPIYGNEAPAKKNNFGNNIVSFFKGRKAVPA